MRTLCLLVLIVPALLGCRTADPWPHLKAVDPSLRILDDPARLLETASSAGATGGRESGQGVDETEVRHEAVRALLALQGRRFNVRIPAVKANHTSGIDHIFVRMLSSNANSVTLMATPTLRADRRAAEGDYWQVEELQFERTGRLISRQGVRL